MPAYVINPMVSHGILHYHDLYGYGPCIFTVENYRHRLYSQEGEMGCCIVFESRMPVDDTLPGQVSAVLVQNAAERLMNCCYEAGLTTYRAIIGSHTQGLEGRRGKVDWTCKSDCIAESRSISLILYRRRCYGLLPPASRGGNLHHCPDYSCAPCAASSGAKE